MFQIRKLLILTTLLLASSSAHAGLMIEPYLGYESSTQTAPAMNTLGDNSGQITGVEYGGRLGYSFPMMLWVALDGTLSSTKFKAANTGTNINFASNMDADLSRSTAGITVGVNLPILLRVWAGYNLVDNFTTKNSANSNKDKYEGTSMKAGIGFKLIPMLSLNVEAIQRKYTKASGDSYPSGTNFGSTTRFSKLEQSSVVISVSVPLNL